MGIRFLEMHKMQTFNENDSTVSETKSQKIKEILKEVILFSFEILMTILPFLIVMVITLLIKNNELSIDEVFEKDDLIWFSITTLVLLSLKTVFSNKKARFENKLIVSLTLVILIIFVGIFVFLKLHTLGIIVVELNNEVVEFCVLMCTIASSLINLASIVSNGGR